MKNPFAKFFRKISLDKLVARIVALGIPGLVLLIAIIVAGPSGGAAIVAALAALGGPVGMIGGIIVLGLLVLIAQAIAEYGAEAIFVRVVRGLKEKGHTKAEVLKKIDSYLISLSLKLKLREYVEKFWDDGGDASGQAAVIVPPITPRDGSAAKDIPSQNG